MDDPIVIRDILRESFLEQSTTADRAAAAETGLWVLTAFVGIALLIWAVFGHEEATARLRAVANLWPLAGVWIVALAVRTRTLARVRRELLGVGAILAVGDRKVERGVV